MKKSLLINILIIAAVAVVGVMLIITLKDIALNPQNYFTTYR